LITDPFGENVGIPMIIAVGKFVGPKVLIVSTIRGDEINGIPLIQKFFNEINVNEIRGIIAAVL
jgi:uncharacterized protein